MPIPLLVSTAVTALTALLLIDVQQASPPAPSPASRPAPLSDRALAAAIDEEVARAAADDRFSGIVMVARHRAGGAPAEILHTRVAGLADREQRIAVTPETRFRIGSMNKMFTAVAILQLAQAGKLKLTQPIGSYLRDYPNKTVASTVTVHQLLTHTGGTGNIFTPEYFARRLETKSLDDYLALFGARDLAFTPGSRWDYSNYGFILLGLIVERVSGVSYYDYILNKVFTPAGMTSTGSQPESEAVPNRSIGYTRPPGGGEGWRPNTDTLPYRGSSAGGGYSTAGDLVRFADALLSHKLLDETHTSLLLTGKVDLPPPRMGPAGAGPGPGPGPSGPGPVGPAGPAPAGSEGRREQPRPRPIGPDGPPGPPPVMKYAYGFQERTQDGRRSVGHGGGAPGQNGELTFYPTSGYIVVSLANLDPPAATRLAQFVDRRLP